MKTTDQVPYEGSVEQWDGIARGAYQQYFDRDALRPDNIEDAFVAGARWQRFQTKTKEEALARLNAAQPQEGA